MLVLFMITQKSMEPNLVPNYFDLKTFLYKLRSVVYVGFPIGIFTTTNTPTSLVHTILPLSPWLDSWALDYSLEDNIRPN